MYKYFPHTEADISEMLGKIGLSSLDELYAEIPENIRFDKDYDLKKMREFRKKFMSSCDGHATERILKLVFGESW